jgi:hypothetical protein
VKHVERQAVLDAPRGRYTVGEVHHTDRILVVVHLENERSAGHAQVTRELGERVTHILGAEHEIVEQRKGAEGRYGRQPDAQVLDRSFLQRTCEERSAALR